MRLLPSLISRHGVERSRYENNLTLGVNDGAKPGLTKHRTAFPRAVPTLAAIKQEEGKTNPYIPKHQRERQRPLEERERESDWNVDGKVGVAMSTTIGHRRLPLLRHIGGSHKNGKCHKNDKNGKDGENGNIKCSISELSFFVMNLFKGVRTTRHFANLLHIRIFSSRSFA